MAYHPNDRPPIVSPFYLQYERFPYHRGPNYVRPMFRENSRGGAFRARPIERIQAPVMMGLGSICMESSKYLNAVNLCRLNDTEAEVENCIDTANRTICPGESNVITLPEVEITPGPGTDIETDTGKKDVTKSLIGFFKDESGNWNPFKLGLLALAGAVVVKQYKKGNR